VCKKTKTSSLRKSHPQVASLPKSPGIPPQATPVYGQPPGLMVHCLRQIVFWGNTLGDRFGPSVWGIGGWNTRTGSTSENLGTMILLGEAGAVTNVEIADVFDQIADLLEFQGANPFRVRAYRNAARTIREQTESLEQMVYSSPASLQEISGIGADLADKISTLVKTGSLPLLEELREQVPIGVLEVMRVPGLGPKRAAALYRELSIASLEQLREACVTQKVRDLPGFGAKTEEKILQGIELAAEAGRRTLWAEADWPSPGTDSRKSRFPWNRTPLNRGFV